MLPSTATIGPSTPTPPPRAPPPGRSRPSISPWASQRPGSDREGGAGGGDGHVAAVGGRGHGALGGLVDSGDDVGEDQAAGVDGLGQPTRLAGREVLDLALV